MISLRPGRTTSSVCRSASPEIRTAWRSAPSFGGSLSMRSAPSGSSAATTLAPSATRRSNSPSKKRIRPPSTPITRPAAASRPSAARKAGSQPSASLQARIRGASGVARNSGTSSWGSAARGGAASGMKPPERPLAQVMLATAQPAQGRPGIRATISSPLRASAARNLASRDCGGIMGAGRRPPAGGDGRPRSARCPRGKGSGAAAAGGAPGRRLRGPSTVSTGISPAKVPGHEGLVRVVHVGQQEVLFVDGNAFGAAQIDNSA